MKMEKLLLIFILVIVSNSAMAEWVFVAETDKEIFLPSTLILPLSAGQETM